MYKLCKTGRSAQRQRQLEEGLLRAMLVKSYEEITISDLCEQMGIPRKSFYRYFSSKDGALHALIDHTLQDFEESTGLLSGNHEWDIDQGLLYFFEFWKQQKPLMDALGRSGLSVLLIQRSITQTRSELAAARSPGAMKYQNVHPHTVTFCICGLMSIMASWHRTGYRETAQEMADIASKLLTQPLIQP